MTLQLEIPKEFECDYENDRFDDFSDESLQTLILLECVEIMNLKRFR